MTARPGLSKQLAARIRKAQRSVIDLRLRIVADTKRLNQDRARTAEYEADPTAFASRYYGNNGADSYPVQTNIERCRENIEYRERRLPELIGELAAAEQALAVVEDAVLSERIAIGPRARGSEPWPEPLPNFEKFRLRLEAEWRQNELEWERERVSAQLEQAKLDEEEDQLLAAKHAVEDEAALVEYRSQLAKMSPEERAREVAASAALKEALARGTITFDDVLAHLNGHPLGARDEG